MNIRVLSANVNGVGRGINIVTIGNRNEVLETKNFDTHKGAGINFNFFIENEEMK